MPIYEYHCTVCGHHFETIQRFNDEALIDCPVCGKVSLEKLISAPAFHLKGTGWYVTDFKDKAKPSTESKREEPKEKQQDKSKEVKKEVTESTGSKGEKSTTTKKIDKTEQSD
ncbi:MAG: zinc ribbon domain-containing protein [Pseudomonadota bacterium]